MEERITPAELLQRAHAMAGLIAGMPEMYKDSELIKLKKADPTLHALVKKRMEDIRGQTGPAKEG